MSKYSTHIVIIFLATSLASVLLFYFGLFNSWQERVFDRFFISKPAPQSLVIFSIDNESIAKIGQFPWSRSVFATAIQKLQKAKVIGLDVNFSEASVNNPEGDLTLASAMQHSLPSIILPLEINSKTQEQVFPLDIFARYSMLGQVNIPTEDGVARKMDNFSTIYPSFGAATVLQYQKNLSIPNSMRIDYVGPEKTITTIPISDLLADKVPESIFTNKMVLIGATAPDLHDSLQTPFGSLPGVEIHANIISTILGQHFYYNVPFWISLLLILLFNAIAAVVIITIKKFRWLVFWLLVTLVGINLFAIILFSLKIIFPVLYADFGFLTTAAILIIFQYITESKQKKFIHDSFKYYLAPNIIDEIIKDPAKLKIGGERKKVTVLLSDIRGFTSIAEKLTPEQLGHILNEYFTAMGEVVIAQKGLVVEYVGDAAMAFWGAPLPNENQAQDACLAAIQMIKAVAQLNQHWQEQKIGITLDIGIGISTGEVVVGNFGSSKRFRYTAIGDEINFTSRIESLNKVYGSHIIISEATQKALINTSFALRELDTIIVKGKKEPKIIFELMTSILEPETLAHFNAGREYYKKGDWAQAIAEFELSAPKDSASKMFLERCQELQKNPPSEWNGIYAFKTK